jgi:hypothetical protein
MKRIVALICVATALVVPHAALAAPFGAGSQLTAVVGQGSGAVKLSPDSRDHGTLHLQGTVSLHGAVPNATFTVQRAIDLTPGNGSCTPIPGTPQDWATVATLTTSDGGAGAAHFERPAPLTSGTEFDVMVRAQTPDGSQLLISGCMTVTVK